MGILSRGRRCSKLEDRSRGPGSCDGHGLDFYPPSLGKSCHLESRPCWFVIAEKLLVDSVDGSKVCHVGHKNRRLNDGATVQAGFFKNVLDILHGPSRLLLNTARHEFHRLRIQTELPGYVKRLLANELEVMLCKRLELSLLSRGYLPDPPLLPDCMVRLPKGPMK